MLAFAAERAVERILAVAAGVVRHPQSSVHCPLPAACAATNPEKESLGQAPGYHNPKIPAQRLLSLRRERGLISTYRRPFHGFPGSGRSDPRLWQVWADPLNS